MTHLKVPYHVQIDKRATVNHNKIVLVLPKYADIDEDNKTSVN
jgi:hypothetical protein